MTAELTPDPPPRPRRRRRGAALGTITPAGYGVRYLLLVLVALISVGPFLYELSTSFKGILDNVYSLTPQLIPAHPTFDNYRQVIQEVPVLRFGLNSVIVGALVVGGQVVGAPMAGYALSRLHFRGRLVVFGLFLSTLVLPAEATLISQLQVLSDLGLRDTLLGVALPGMVGAGSVILMRLAFDAVPRDLDEAAMLDGADVFQRFLRIGLPNVVGMLAVISIMAFIGTWDDFLWPLLVLQTPSHLTLTVGLSYLDGLFVSNPRLIAAGVVIALVPIFAFFLILQRYFFRGVSEGAVRG